MLAGLMHSDGVTSGGYRQRQNSSILSVGFIKVGMEGFHRWGGTHPMQEILTSLTPFGPSDAFS